MTNWGHRLRLLAHLIVTIFLINVYSFIARGKSVKMS